MNLFKPSVTNNTKRKETDKSWMWDMTGKDILVFFNKSTACASKKSGKQGVLLD